MAVWFLAVGTSGTTKAASVETDLEVNVASVIAMSLVNCDATDSSTVKINVTPSSTGVFKSNCQTVSVNTNMPGYTLSVYQRNGLPGEESTTTTTGILCTLDIYDGSLFPKFNCLDSDAVTICQIDYYDWDGTSMNLACYEPATTNEVCQIDNMPDMVNDTAPVTCTGEKTVSITIYDDSLVYRNPTSISPVPTIASTTFGLSSPNTLINDTWGFAAENRLDFDAAYTIDNAANNYAALPTTDTAIYTTDVFPIPVSSHDFHYAAKLTSENVAGTYSTTVTYTVIGAEVPPAPISFQQISAGANHVCAVMSGGDAYCWGGNPSGQLGNESTGDRSNVPVLVSRGAVPDGITFKQVQAGFSHTCAIASDDKAYCWGDDSFGQLGSGSLQRSTPVAVAQGAMPAGATIRQLAVGSNHTCAIASDNQAYCWGEGNSGQLGNGTNQASSVPVAVTQGALPAGSTIKQIAAGGSHTCLIASDDKAYCWGSGGSGQLGSGVNSNSNSPISVLFNKTIKQITAGTSHTCVIASDDDPYCWGSGGQGVLGNNSTTSSNIPVAVVNNGALSGLRSISISANSAYHTCVVADDNNAYCWGYNRSGQLGDGTGGGGYGNYKAYPVAVSKTGLLNGLTIRQLSSGGDTTCAVASNKNAYCWGSNTLGQLGNGTDGNGTNIIVPGKVINPTH